ncbi:hypothetical protein KXV85_003541, partial [Aspergillus fumigatus]
MRRKMNGLPRRSSCTTTPTSSSGRSITSRERNMGDALVNASSNEPTFTTRLHADASLGTTSDPRGAAEGRRMRSGTNAVRKIENPALRAGALVLFALRRAWLTVRYGRRLQLGPGIVFKGRLVLGRGVRVSIGANCRIGKRVLITGRGQ